MLKIELIDVTLMLIVFTMHILGGLYKNETRNLKSKLNPPPPPAGS